MFGGEELFDDREGSTRSTENKAVNTTNTPQRTKKGKILFEFSPKRSILLFFPAGRTSGSEACFVTRSAAKILAAG